MPLPRVEHTVLPIAAFVPAGYNPRTITAAARKGLRASLTKFGLVQGVVLNRRPDGELRIVGGHQRVDELLAIGEVEAAVAIVELNDTDERALNLALNNPAIAGEWKPEELARLLEEVQSQDEALFASLRLDTLFAEAEIAASGGTGDPAAPAPPPPAVPTSRLGDIWLLGNHRLICGDSTDAATVALLLAGVKPHLMVTDPPYGVAYDPAWREGHDARRGKKTGPAQGLVRNDHVADWREAWALFPGDVAYVWHGALLCDVVKASLVAHRFDMRAQIVWAKNQFPIGRGHYHWQHEVCWYAVRGVGHWSGGRAQSTLWSIPSLMSGQGARGDEDAATGHGTQKPVECMRRPIENNSNPGQAVYEPFSGSGTTIIAGEMTGRHVYAVEIDPGYVDAAVLRWQAFTGGGAVLESSRRTFADVAAERKVPT